MTIRHYVTVVTGMPRSGTSVMMQMLDAGGIPALTDNRRPPDLHNPKGYFEYEPVKRIAQDSSWMEAARGKAVKIIYRLLPYLPPDFEYRVIFMERDLREVFASQRDMLRARGDAAVEQPADLMIAAFEGELKEMQRWLKKQRNIDSRLVRYRDIISDAARWSLLISPFLDGLDVAAMAAVVDPKLRHHRIR